MYEYIYEYIYEYGAHIIDMMIKDVRYANTNFLYRIKLARNLFKYLRFAKYFLFKVMFNFLKHQLQRN